MPETCILSPVCLGAAIQLIDEGARDRERTMNNWGLTIGLVVAFFFSNPAWADDPNAILSKEDSAQMFAMSEAQLTCPQYPVTRHESPDTGGRSDHHLSWAEERVWCSDRGHSKQVARMSDCVIEGFTLKA